MYVNVTINDIMEINDLKSYTIYIDQILDIPINELVIPYNINLESNENKKLNEKLINNKIRITYKSLLGVRELTGNNDGVKVQEILSYSGLSGNYPWCAATINYTLMVNGIDLKLKYPAYVPSYFPEYAIIFERGKIDQKRDFIIGEDLIGIYINNKKRLGHTGFYDGQDDKYYYSVEGNTNDIGSDEGDGVYRKKRIKKQVRTIGSWKEIYKHNNLQEYNKMFK
jgi:hypothetical protein